MKTGMCKAHEILGLLALLFLRLSCRAVKLPTTHSRLLFVSTPFHSHLNILITIARALPPHHYIAFALFDESVEMVRDKLEAHRPVTIVPLGSLIKRTFETRSGESNLAFFSRVVLPNSLALYAQTHNPLLTHLSIHSYDMMIVDQFAFAAQDLAHDLNVPMAVHSCTAVVGVLDLPAWVPRGFDATTQEQLRQSFSCRFYNHVVTRLLMIYHIGPHMLKMNQLRRAFNRSVPHTMFGLSSPMQRWQGHPIFISSPVAFEFRRAYTPNYHFIGFVRADQRTNQADDSEESWVVNTWLNKARSSDDFIVLVAFGTLNNFCERIWEIFVDTVRLVPNMHILFTIPNQANRIKVHALLERLPDQQSRVLVVSWINQQHVLAHHSLRVFITHGGLNSIGEAVYAQAPLLILPGFGDQFTNAAKVETTKIGRALDPHTVTATELAAYIKQLHADHDKFVQHLLRIHRLNELEGGGAQRAAKLIDGWLNTGYAHLDTLEHQLPFLVATSLDVQLTLLAIAVFISYLLFRIVALITRTLSCHFRKRKRE